MLYSKKRAEQLQPRVTPDSTQAEALRRKLAALDYVPSNGFHKDRQQLRIGSPLLAGRWHRLA